MMMPSLFSLIAIAVVVILLLKKLNQGNKIKVVPRHSNGHFQERLQRAIAQSPHHLQAYTELLRLCNADIEMVEQIIQKVLNENPSFNRAQASATALKLLQEEKHIP